MSDTQSAFPLSWPQGRPRAPYRRSAAFKPHTIESTRIELERQIGLLGGTRVVLSSNLKLRKDGLPISGQPQPADTGVAVFFTMRDKRIALACDRWTRVEHNIWAIAKDVEAQRGRERWGATTMEQAFAGYAALPEKTGDAWWDVLGIPAHSGVDEIKSAYREKSLVHHPDRGGSHDGFVKLRTAYELALLAKGVTA